MSLWNHQTLGRETWKFQSKLHIGTDRPFNAAHGEGVSKSAEILIQAGHYNP